MISLQQGFNAATFFGLLKDLPQDVLNQLGRTLNEEGPCNWRALHQIVAKNMTFSTEEYERLTQTTPVDSSVFLSILCEKGVSVGFLLEQLRLLPCQCSWKVLNNYLSSDRVMRQREYSSVIPVPVDRTVPINSNWSPHSLPPNFECTFDTDTSVISEHPKEHICVRLNDQILLRCSIKSSFHGKPIMQWYHMYKPIQGQTSHMLMILNAKPSDEGYYCCKITYGEREEKSHWSYVSVGHDISNNPRYFATDKVALLIANEHYRHHKRLPAAPCDLEVLTNILQKELNFKTFSFVNLTLTEILRALNWLCSLAENGCYCVFYFGGHGYENDGKCFMVPVDAPKDYGDASCINVHTELENIQRRCSPSLMLILLDICRKRNTKERAPKSMDHPTAFRSNVVLAYATMESREAFERRGERHGVFVESLRKHLAQPKRVNFMLTDVQDDVQRSCLQVAEVRTTLAEERCLTDYIRPRPGRVKVHTEWMNIHGMLSNNVLTTELGKNMVARIHLVCRPVLTNKMEILLYLSEIDKTKYKAYCLYIKPESIQQSANRSHAFEVDLMPEKISLKPFVMRISNLQRLKGPLTATIVFQCESRIHENKWYERVYHEKLLPSLHTYWNSNKKDPFSEST